MTVEEHGRNKAARVQPWSTMVRIESKVPFGGKPMMRSIVTVSNGSVSRVVGIL